MAATEQTTGRLEVEAPILDRVRRRAEKNGQKIKFVATVALKIGLDVMDSKEQKQPANVAAGQS